MNYKTQLLLFCLVPFISCSKADTPEKPPDSDPPEPKMAEPALNLTFDNSEIQRSTSPVLNSYAPILKDAKNAVVSVYTAQVIRVVRNNNPSSMEEYLLRRFFGMPAPPRRPITEDDIEERRVPQGVGSGVIISKDGYILTNNHVVSDERGGDADEVLVRLSDGTEYRATIVGRDPRTDIAVLKIEGEEDLPTIPISNSDQTEVGDIVFAIGNPMGVGITVTQGIVSATGRAIGIYGEEGYEDFIQTDASINMGNSGGALVDIEGRLVGVNSAILSRSGGNIGIGFAIPTNLAVGIARQLVEYGEVRRGYLGVRTDDLTTELAEAFNLEERTGALVNQVDAGGPADQAGVLHGDVIVSVDDKPIENTYELRLRVGQLLPGTAIRLGVIRDGEFKELPTTLGENEPPQPVQMVEGIYLAPLDATIRQKLRLPENINGVVIAQMESNSPYRRSFALGMVILSVNQQPVIEPDEVLELLQPGTNRLRIYHQGNVGYIDLTLR